MQSELKLGIIGFGEVGYSLSRGLKSEGLNDIYVFDVAFSVEEKASDFKKRADEINVYVCKNIKELVEKTDVVFSVNTSSVAVKVAEETSSHISSRHLYVDLNTTSSDIQKTISGLLKNSGCKFADAAIMGAISDKGHKTNVIASGNGRTLFYDLFTPYGMNIDADLVEEPGQASGLKLYRSIFAKGIEALIIEMLVASYRDGVGEQVFSMVCSWMNNQKDFNTLFKTLVSMHAVHAGRRTVEMEHVCDAIEKIGLEPLMSDATKGIMERTRNMNSESFFKNVDPENYRDVIAFIEKKL